MGGDRITGAVDAALRVVGLVGETGIKPIIAPGGKHGLDGCGT
jgi:hypothetical protein